MFAMWMSDIHSLGGYTFAAGLFALGLGAWQVFLALVVGILIVFFLMNFSGYAGRKPGSPIRCSPGSRLERSAPTSLP